MSDYESLNHSIWDCKYHIVRIPNQENEDKKMDQNRGLFPELNQKLEQTALSILHFRPAFRDCLYISSIFGATT